MPIFPPKDPLEGHDSTSIRFQLRILYRAEVMAMVEGRSRNETVNYAIDWAWREWAKDADQAAIRKAEVDVEAKWRAEGRWPGSTPKVPQPSKKGGKR